MVITDIGLPGMSGYDLTRSIRKWEALHHKFSTPIIGLTAHAKLKTAKECMHAGMNDVFSKPINIKSMTKNRGIYQKAFIIAPAEGK